MWSSIATETDNDGGNLDRNWGQGQETSTEDGATCTEEENTGKDQNEIKYGFCIMHILSHWAISC